MDYAAIVEFIVAMLNDNEVLETINGILRVIGELIGQIFQ